MGPHAGLDQLSGSGSSSVVNGSSYPTSHRLRHTSNAADFQPPYFPPPYSVPQPQSTDFSHHPGLSSSDPYTHLNHHYNSPQQYISAERHLLGGHDPITGSLQRTFQGCYDARRAAEYAPVVSRQDLFLSGRGGHDLSDPSFQFALQSGIGMHGLEEAAQVRHR